MLELHWYNPKTKAVEDTTVPMSEAQAIEMLSGDPDSDRFIEVYRRMRCTHPDIVESLILTGEVFRVEHLKE